MVLVNCKPNSSLIFKRFFLRRSKNTVPKNIRNCWVNISSKRERLNLKLFTQISFVITVKLILSRVSDTNVSSEVIMIFVGLVSNHFHHMSIHSWKLDHHNWLQFQFNVNSIQLRTKLKRRISLWNLRWFLKKKRFTLKLHKLFLFQW